MDTDGPIETPVENTETETSQEQPQQEAGETQENSENSGNPAWQEFLDALPTSLHGQVTPILEKWDKGVQQRFSDIHTEYEPYKSFKEQSVDPETINYALGIVNALNEDPRQVYDSLAEYYKFEATAAEMVPANGESIDGEWNPETESYTDPRIAKLEEGVQLMAQMLMDEQQAKAQAAEDSKLSTELADLKTKFGDYDENFVLGRMLNGDTPEAAVKAYQDIVNNIQTNNNRPPAPKVIGGGGAGVVSKSVNPASLTESQRKAYIVESLKKAAQEG
jgi:hypothetical protein